MSYGENILSIVFLAGWFVSKMKRIGKQLQELQIDLSPKLKTDAQKIESIHSSPTLSCIFDLTFVGAFEIKTSRHSKGAIEPWRWVDQLNLLIYIL